ncbi:MAG: CBS domain-containing protein [Elusimicrobiota bacterium]
MKKKIEKKYLSKDGTFHIVEDKLKKENQNIQETNFTLGNGFIGSRGVLEENPMGSSPGTFISGVYDKSGAQVEELVNLPNPICFMVAAEGEKMDIFTMKVLDHKRILDMKNGVLYRRTVFLDAKNRKYIYKSIRFFSMKDPHIGAMKISIRMVKGTASLTAIDRIDDSIYNKGGLMIQRKRHFDTIKADKEGHLDYAAFKTHTYNTIISYGDRLFVKKGKAGKSLRDRFYEFKLRTNQEIVFEKFFSVYTSRDYSSKSIKRETIRSLNEAADKGFDELFKEHVQSLNKKWSISDISIQGDDECQRAIRFNIYHTLIAAREEYGDCSIGAKTLSGQGYRGHVFWDTEIFILPFFILNHPEIAKKMLMFRYKTLPMAKENAESKNYDGAMYPWETTINGTEETPRYAKDIDGSIVEVRTQDFEHHITADVSFGVYKYYQFTGDKNFMYKYGAEIIFETAKFWASRVSFSRKDQKYHIKRVIGPDEFHVDVDDNAYTNFIAKWNLKYGVKLYEKFKDSARFKKVINKLNITQKEINKWNKIGDNIKILTSPKYDIIKQFKGYMNKNDYEVGSFDRYFLPQAPKIYTYKGLYKTRLLKQADVLLIFCLFPDLFSIDEKRKNFNYYVKRTLHKSSLSYSTHSYLSSQIGDRFRAFQFFWICLNIDLENIANNTGDGIHAANLGGVWQALIYGFAGLNLRDDSVIIDPFLPGNIKKIKFKFYNKGDLYNVDATNSKVEIKVLPKENKEESRTISVFGKKYNLIPEKTKIIKKEGKKINMICAKDIMKKKNLITVNEAETVKSVGNTLINNKISSVSVVDKKKNLLGIISEKNIIQATLRNGFNNLKAKDIMKEEVVWVDYNDPLEKITKIFIKNPYRRIPVVKDKKVVGVITRRDIISDFLGGYY